MATRIGRFQPAPVTAVATPPLSGWQWLRFTQPGLPDVAESHVIPLAPGWWEITVEWPQSATFRIYDTIEGSSSVSLPTPAEGTLSRTVRREFVAGNPRVQVESSISAEYAGKEFWIVARPM